MLTFASVFVSSFNIVSMLTLIQRIGKRTHSLHLCFVTIVSINFENADIDAKFEWALIRWLWSLSSRAFSKILV